MWILILTIASTHLAAIDHVPGFTTQAGCMAAAKAWLDSRSDTSGRSALCVKQ